MDYFWPLVTGHSLLDVWTLAHLGFWIFVGSSLWALKVKKRTALIICMSVTIAWELFEYFVAFRLWPDRWQDPESWVNSLVSDPLTCVVGVLGMWYLLDRRRRRKGS